MNLHPKAATLLQAIHSHGTEVRVADLEEDMDHGDIMRPAAWLEDYGLLNIDEQRETRYTLTETGETAYINGLPEKRLLQEIKDEPRPIAELQQSFDGFNAALGRCKQNDWIELIDSGNGKQVQITDQGRDKLQEGFTEEQILRSIEETGKTDNDAIAGQLVERGLLEKQETVEQILRITDKGEEIVEKGIDKVDDSTAAEGKIGTLTPEAIQSGAWKEKGLREYNVEADVDVKRPGKRHPYRQYLDEVRQKLLAMGFQEAKTDLVEMEFWNFDVLFQAQDHPAREIHDKFELKNPSHGDLMHNEIVERVKEMHEQGADIDSSGWQYEWSSKKASKLMLRSQTTATTIRYLARGLESPAKVFAIDRNFRYDEIDQTHFVEFYQAEGIVKAPDLSLKNLFGYLKVFGEEIAGAEKIRFRPGYFPFTEPSVELDAYHPEMGWIELGGAGLFRPEVRNPLGVDEPVIAWGMGIDRLAMFKLGIDDIRELVFPQDLDYLRKSPAVTLR
jgi:phenylalanyl-tRNA synthetase alpha chain